MDQETPRQDIWAPLDPGAVLNEIEYVGANCLEFKAAGPESASLSHLNASLQRIAPWIAGAGDRPAHSVSREFGQEGALSLRWPSDELFLMAADIGGPSGVGMVGSLGVVPRIGVLLATTRRSDGADILREMIGLLPVCPGALMDSLASEALLAMNAPVLRMLIRLGGVPTEGGALRHAAVELLERERLRTERGHEPCVEGLHLRAQAREASDVLRMVLTTAATAIPSVQLAEVADLLVSAADKFLARRAATAARLMQAHETAGPQTTRPSGTGGKTGRRDNRPA